MIIYSITYCIEKLDGSVEQPLPRHRHMQLHKIFTFSKDMRDIS